MQKLLPSRYPGGLVIADESKRQFLQQMDIKKFGALSFEAALSEVTNTDAQAHPTEQDLVDLQHAVGVVPYVDVAVLDGKFCKYALTVKKNGKGAEPLAKCFDNVTAALDWIEKEAVLRTDHRFLCLISPHSLSVSSATYRQCPPCYDKQGIVLGVSVWAMAVPSIHHHIT